MISGTGGGAKPPGGSAFFFDPVVEVLASSFSVLLPLPFLTVVFDFAVGVFVSFSFLSKCLNIEFLVTFGLLLLLDFGGAVGATSCCSFSDCAVIPDIVLASAVPASSPSSMSGPFCWSSVVCCFPSDCMLFSSCSVGVLLFFFGVESVAFVGRLGVDGGASVAS